ncbi:hypothetical protein H924_07345 [Corynebacterium callunae DSM 20147]|uniref:HTH cro/C1-type domain-containing protein n=2 Tax=Corynebacterium callunae TaxID=1721 RepID=M1TRJ8_9CORY|nr:hypothetical protein [Corynebacterium callunae]AGG66911.1 hypothetical protein H924_07345 [Corynebacterium callunae DSM 20147]
MNALNNWVAQVTGDDSWRVVAEKLRTTHSTIQRRLKNHDSDAIIEIARAYDVNPIEGLIASGALTPLDARAYSAVWSVSDFSDVELAQIIVSRLEEREAFEKESDDVHPVRYVADDTDTEPGMGDEGYHDGP